MACIVAHSNGQGMIKVPYNAKAVKVFDKIVNVTATGHVMIPRRVMDSFGTLNKDGRRVIGIKWSIISVTDTKRMLGLRIYTPKPKLLEDLVHDGDLRWSAGCVLAEGESVEDLGWDIVEDESSIPSLSNAWMIDKPFENYDVKTLKGVIAYPDGRGQIRVPNDAKKVRIVDTDVRVMVNKCIRVPKCIMEKYGRLNALGTRVIGIQWKRLSKEDSLWEMLVYTHQNVVSTAGNGMARFGVYSIQY